MAYKALYRTYRPSTFDEVVGQQHIVKTLKNALATNKLAHAYLFTGPRGTGKTTMAKLFAKALNCEDGLGNICNECKNCKAIIEGSHPDVLEIDAASNRGINEIRDLIDKVKYAPILGKYKVYIIDEVHMMTTEAFNALLKTLEEPPEQVIFILATTEPHKVLPTILSRCQRYDFSKVSDEDIKTRLQIVLEKENIEYNDDAVNLIINLADGGMRDALSILDQVLAYSGNKLDEEDVLNIFALESKQEKMALLNSIAHGDVCDVLNRLNKYISKGSDIKKLTNDLLLILKDLLVFSYTRRSDYLQAISGEEVKELLPLISTTKATEMIDVLMNAIKEYKNVSDINPLFEVTLLKLTNTAVKKDEIKQTFFEPIQEIKIEPKPVTQDTPKPIVQETPEPIIEEDKSEIQNDEKTSQNVDILTEKPAKAEEKQIEQQPTETDLFMPVDNVVEENKIIELKGSSNGETYNIDSDTMIKIMVTSKKEIKNQIMEQWKNIKRLTAHPTLGKMATLLIDAHPLVASNQILIVEFSLPKIVDKANMLENQRDMQNIISTIFGRKLFVFGISRVQSVEFQKTYRNLLEISKLPKANTITLEFEEK